MRTLASQITGCPPHFYDDQAQDARALFPDVPPRSQAPAAGAGSTFALPFSVDAKGKTDWCARRSTIPLDVAVQHVMTCAGDVARRQLASHLRQGKRRVAR